MIKTEKQVLKTKGEVAFLQFKIFEKYPELTCAFSSRIGGKSEGYFGDMNLEYENDYCQEK